MSTASLPRAASEQGSQALNNPKGLNLDKASAFFGSEGGVGVQFRGYEELF